jgi:hypothetical protein
MYPSMHAPEQRVATAICVVFELDDDPINLIGPASSLLDAAKRGEGEMALRQQLGKLQNRKTGRVVDSDCRQLVQIITRVLRTG